MPKPSKKGGRKPLKRKIEEDDDDESVLEPSDNNDTDGDSAADDIEETGINRSGILSDSDGENSFLIERRS